MEYFLRIRALGKFPCVEISADEYDSAALSRKVLSAALAVEQEWDVLLKNYIELEQDLLSLAVSASVLNASEYRDFFVSTSLVNRRFVNLLTSAKMYVDQVPQSASGAITDLAKNEVVSKVKSMLAEQYDASFEYRFMEALRNFVQHRGAAVRSVSFGGAWTPEFNRKWNESRISPYALRETFVSDKSFKRAVFEEMPEKVNLTSAVRHYLERLGLVHKNLRTMLASQVEPARSLINNLIQKYRGVYSGKPIGLAAHCFNNGNEVGHVALFLEWDDVRQHLTMENSTLINISKRTVTGRTDA